jgi:SAM-dependent methyltransferase
MRMTNHGQPESLKHGPDEQALFLDQWQTYRKVIVHNYMFHREVYDLLHRTLIEDVVKLFRFLDIACGDASATINALRGTSIRHYYGIDISKPALAIARKSLAALGCSVTLENRDFVEALAEWRDPVDVIWIGQSLHHLVTPAKLALMQEVRRVLRESGVFLIWEPTTIEGEDRDGWVTRFETVSRPLWSSLSEVEWTAMLSHIRAADHPESSSRWLSLAHEAGFSSAREIFVAPTALARVYLFRT